MSDWLLAVTVALLGWWLSTGVILYLNHLPRRTHRWSMLAATVVLVFCFLEVPSTSEDSSREGAVVAFMQAILIWGWLEMSYLMGFITGPRSAPCPPDVTGRERFWLAVQTSLWHELSVVAATALVVALTWNAPNQIAAWSCIALWLMRWSAKLNLFLGVLNYNEEWLPDHLRYLTTYTRRRAMNMLFPVSVVVGTSAATALVLSGLNGTEEVVRTGHVLVGALVALAVLEHWFLVLPLHDSALWQWALPPADREKKVEENCEESGRRATAAGL
jgi:putative photosynthetic complex assembly protein 2